MKTTIWNHATIEPEQAEVSFVESQLCDCKGPVMVEVVSNATLAFTIRKAVPQWSGEGSPYPYCKSVVTRVNLGVIGGNPGALTGLCSDCGAVVNLSLGPQEPEKLGDPG